MFQLSKVYISSFGKENSKSSPTNVVALLYAQFRLVLENMIGTNRFVKKTFIQIYIKKIFKGLFPVFEMKVFFNLFLLKMILKLIDVLDNNEFLVKHF